MKRRAIASLNKVGAGVSVLRGGLPFLAGLGGERGGHGGELGVHAKLLLGGRGGGGERFGSTLTSALTRCGL
jgi:hypothetical protein